MTFHRRLPVILLFLALLFAAGCVEQTRQGPEVVVEEMYAALAADDMDAYMDTMLPANRRVPNPFMLVRGLGIYGGVGGVQLGFDLKELSAVAFHDLQFTVVEVDGDDALVRAEGTVRYPALAWELPFCDLHDVRRVDGMWYVDVYAPEREARMQQALEQRVQELETNPPTGDDVGDLLDVVGEMSGTMLDFCPR